MNTEQIIKVLECCFINENCKGCPMQNSREISADCLRNAGKKVVPLIKELQAHNENLIKENKYLRERLKEEAELKEDMEGL